MEVTSISDLLAGGGVTTVVAAIAYGLKLWVDGRRERKNDSRLDTAVQLNDASTVNALSMELLREERSENARMQARIDQLEGDTMRLRTELIEQRAEYEDELRQLKDQTLELQRRINEMTARLSSRPSPEGE